MNRKIAPEVKKIGKVNLALPEKSFLDNGIPVYLINAGEQDVVKIEFIINAALGSFFYNNPLPPDRKGSISALLPKFTLEMLTEGTKSFSADKIAEILDYYSAFLDKDCERDKITISVTCLNKHLQYILPVMKELIIEPVFPDSNLDILINNKRQHFLLNNEKVSYVAKHQFKNMLYGDSHPYGIITKIEDFDHISSRQLIDFHNSYYLPSSVTYIIISGKIHDNIIGLLNNYFGFDWNSQNNNAYKKPSADNSKAFHDTLNPKHLFIARNSAVQSAVRIGKIMNDNKLNNLTYAHPDYFSFRILNIILGGYFGSRLMSNIREDKGFTYGISSNLITLYNSAYFFITSQIGVEYVNMAVSEIYKEIDRLQNDKVTDDELNLVRNYMQGILLRSMDGPFAIADTCKTMIEYNLNDDYFDNYIDKIQNINKEEIISTAQRYLQTDAMNELIVGSR